MQANKKPLEFSRGQHVNKNTGIIKIIPYNYNIPSPVESLHISRQVF